jgi:hypothetical protein
MDQSPAQFVVAKLNEPDVSLVAVADATGIPVRTLQHLKGGNAGNAWASRIDLLAAHFGYRFEAVPIKAADEPTPTPRRRSTDHPVT